MANPQSLIYYKSLELENVRCFGEQQVLDLCGSDGRLPQWTLLLGDNGVGKTTLLQCLAWMRPVLKVTTNSQDQDASTDIQPALAEEENKVLDSLLRVAQSAEANIKATLSTGQKLDAAEKKGQALEVKTSIKMEGSNQKLTNFNPHGELPEELEFPSQDMPIFAYGADRRMGRLNIQNAELRDPLASLFSGATELYDAENILLDLDYASTKRAVVASHLEKVKEMLATILPDVKNAQDIKILGPKSLKSLGIPDENSGGGGVRFLTPYGSIPLSALSLGYQTTLAWVLDLATRLYRYYPENNNPLDEPAIVIIDEIDLHLHPLWQRYIIEYLSNLFPQIQFIATAHSPLMAQVTKKANLVVLRQECGQVVIENNPAAVEGWRVDQILTSPLFGLSSSRSPRVEALINEKINLCSKRSLSDTDKIRLSEIEEELDSLPTAETRKDREAMEIIRKAAAIIAKTE